MNKTILAIFFSFIFLSLVTAPTIIMAIDDSIDISFIYNISEEEEEKGKEGNKGFEKFVVDLDTELEGFVTPNNREHLEYAFKKYQKPHLNLIFPPPEFV
ncbi:hypothetical protein [Psychroserpens sp.]|uniref:hypothetical protein n=1 Tax=Psychroserpens sp. TaxID=2020870 RepID=UPI002B27AB53|nr:hypothetical protein [Psychroserpens sp.]